MMQAPGAQPLAVAGAGTHDQRQPLGLLRIDEALFERGVQHFGDAALHEARGANDIAVIDERNGLLGRDDLVLQHGLKRFPLGLLFGALRGGQGPDAPL